MSTNPPEAELSRKARKTEIGRGRAGADGTSYVFVKRFSGSRLVGLGAQWRLTTTSAG
jgi:hypothetical protein